MSMFVIAEPSCERNAKHKTDYCTDYCRGYGDELCHA